MSETKVLSLRLKAETKERLAKIAEATQRSQSFLAAEAIEEFVAVQEWQIEGIHKGLEQLDRGEVVEHEDALAWAQSLGSDNPLPIPKPRKARTEKTKRSA